jgi:hypothetical protein
LQEGEFDRAIVNDVSRDKSHKFLVLRGFQSISGREVTQEMGVNHLGLLPRTHVAMAFADPNCSERNSELATKSLPEFRK